jgi:hypothetical protein
MGAIWAMEDDELLDATCWQLQQLAARGAGGGGEPAAAPDRGGTKSSPGSTPSRQVSYAFGCDTMSPM